MRFSNAAAKAAICALVLPMALPALAQEAAPASGKLQFELNKAETVESGCQLTFVITNGTGTEIEKSSYNMMIVDAQGEVATLITFEFGALTTKRKKGQQFVLPGQPCDQITAISINEFRECIAGGAPSPVCEDAIEESSRTSIQFPW